MVCCVLVALLFEVMQPLWLHDCCLLPLAVRCNACFELHSITASGDEWKMLRHLYVSKCSFPSSPVPAGYAAHNHSAKTTDAIKSSSELSTIRRHELLHPPSSPEAASPGHGRLPSRFPSVPSSPFTDVGTSQAPVSGPFSKWMEQGVRPATRGSQRAELARERRRSSFPTPKSPCAGKLYSVCTVPHEFGVEATLPRVCISWCLGVQWGANT